MSQCANIYQHMLDHGSITPLEAAQLYGCLACHSRIAELRDRGHEIETEMITVGKNKRVGRYSMPTKVAYG